MKTIISLLFVLIFSSSIWGQNIVTSLKGKNGSLWFTVAERGVYHYDGKSFINFTKESYRLNINVLACIYEDKIGNLWFNTDKGLCFYDGKKFTEFKIPLPPISMVGSEKQALLMRSPIQVEDILQDKNGNFWFLTTDHGVYRYNEKLSDAMRNESSFSNFLIDETPNCILETRKGAIFIGSWRGGGVYRYDEKSATSGQAEFTKLNGFSDGMISCMVEDKTGNIWVGTRNAAVDCYNPSALLSQGQKPITNYMKKEGFTNDCAYCIIEDSKGNIWLGSDGKDKYTRGDAFCYDGKSFNNITANIGLTNLEGFFYTVKSLVEDTLGNIWIGSNNGLLFCYDGKKCINFSDQVAK